MKYKIKGRNKTFDTIMLEDTNGNITSVPRANLYMYEIVNAKKEKGDAIAHMTDDKAKIASEAGIEIQKTGNQRYILKTDKKSALNKVTSWIKSHILGK